MSSLTQKLANRKFPHRDVALCLNGDLSQRRDEALSALADALRAQKDGKAQDVRLNTNPVTEAQKTVAAIEDQMRSELITLRFTGVPYGEYNSFIIQNPPRKGNQTDLAYGFNAGEFFMFVARRTGTEIDENGTELPISEADWDGINRALTDGDHDRIANAIIEVNRREGQRGTDFLLRASERTPDSSETFEPPATSE